MEMMHTCAAAYQFVFLWALSVSHVSPFRLDWFCWVIAL